MAKQKAQPAEKIENRLLSKIVPYPQNPRTHSAEQIELLSTLMLKYGVDQPIVVDEAGVILKGHGRRLAALKAGYERFPVVVMRGLGEEDKRAIRIADNQVALLAGWDASLIKLELEQLTAAGFDMPLLGFDQDALAAFMSGAAAPPAWMADAQSLSDQFGIVPFSVFNAREGIWQNRKRAWLALGIQSEAGRGKNLLKFSDSVALDGDAYNERFKQKPKSRYAVLGPQSADIRDDASALRTTTDPYRKKAKVEKALSGGEV